MVALFVMLSGLRAQKEEQPLYSVKSEESMTFEKLTIWIAGHEIEQYVGESLHTYIFTRLSRQPVSSFVILRRG